MSAIANTQEVNYFISPSSKSNINLIFNICNFSNFQ